MTVGYLPGRAWKVVKRTIVWSTWHFIQLQHKLHHLVSYVLGKHLHHEAADLPLVDPITNSLTGVLVEDKPGARRHLVHQHGQGELVRLVQECQELYSTQLDFDLSHYFF